MKLQLSFLFLILTFISYSQISQSEIESKVYEKIKTHKKKLSNYNFKENSFGFEEKEIISLLFFHS